MSLQGYAEMMRRLANRHRVDWVGEFAEVDGEYVHYRAAGAGPAVVLLHGLMAWSYTWRHNLEPLARQAGVRVYAPDLRGHGLTTKGRPGYGLWRQAEFVCRFMDMMQIPRAAVVGHSMGGEVALRMALLAPERVRALVLVSSSCYVRGEIPRPLRWALAIPGVSRLLSRAIWMNARFTRSMLETAYGEAGRVPAEAIACYLFPARSPGAARGLVRLAGEQDFGACAHRVGEVRQPSLLVWGARDPWTTLAQGERLARELPHARLEVFPETGHLPMEESPEQFNRLVGDWLRRTARTGSD